LTSKSRERKARAAFWEAAGLMTRYVSVEPRGLVFLLPTEIGRER
jgi:hypothetical protein